MGIETYTDASGQRWYREPGQPWVNRAPDWVAPAERFVYDILTDALLSGKLRRTHAPSMKHTTGRAA